MIEEHPPVVNVLRLFYDVNACPGNRKSYGQATFHVPAREKLRMEYLLPVHISPAASFCIFSAS